MPNKVTTKVFIEGESKNVKKMVEDASSVFSFEKIIPSPSLKGKELETWRFEHWGTRNTEMNAHIVSEAKNEIIYKFQTEYGYPELVLQELSKLLDSKVTCLFTDEEMGSNCGFLQYEKGKLAMEWYPEDDYTGIAFSAEVNDVDEIAMEDTNLWESYSDYDVQKIEEASENIYTIVPEVVGDYIGA